MKLLKPEDIKAGMKLFCVYDDEIAAWTYLNRILEVDRVHGEEVWLIVRSYDDKPTDWDIKYLTGVEPWGEDGESCYVISWDEIDEKDKMVFKLSGKLPSKYYDIVQ